MINSVRFWTRKPPLRFFAAVEREEPKPKRRKKAQFNFFGDFLKMWENHAELVVRNLDGEHDQ